MVWCSFVGWMARVIDHPNTVPTMGGEYSSWKKTCFILLPENSLVTIVELDLCSVCLLKTILIQHKAWIIAVATARHYAMNARPSCTEQ